MENTSHLLYMDNVTKEKEMIQTIRIYSLNIGMEFGNKKMCHAEDEKC